MNTVPSKAQLLWQCRRGMLELDFFLEKFMANHFEKLSDNEKILFSQLLKQEDPMLYDWLVVGQELPNNQFEKIIKLIRS